MMAVCGVHGVVLDEGGNGSSLHVVLGCTAPARPLATFGKASQFAIPHHTCRRRTDAAKVRGRASSRWAAPYLGEETNERCP